MSLPDSNGRTELLERYGRWYGQEHFAIAFTATLQGENAKRVTTEGWDTTRPLPSSDFAAGLIGQRGQTRNVAIVLRPSNLVVLECDTEADLVRIEQLALPATITVRSSKPYKRHFYFRPPEELSTLPFVAFRFESGKLTADSGRYFLAPPSIHPSGAIYAFLRGLGPGDVDIAELPETTYRMLADTARQEDEQQRERIHVDPNAKVHAGQRGDSLFRYASMLRRWGLTRDQILNATLEWNEARCDPPIERTRVETQVDGAMKKRGDQELERAAAHPIPDHLDPIEERDSWEPINLGALDEKPPIQPTLGNIGIVYPGKRHVFSGPQESAKTLAAYAIALEVVRRHGDIVVIDFEMGQCDARDRLRDLGATPTDFAHIRYIDPHEPATPERIARLVAIRPELVIIDAAAGAYDLQGLDDNKRSDVERFTRMYVRDFWRNGIATIVLDHVVKNTETRGKYAIGSERKVGGADVHLGFEVITPIKRGTTGIYKILTHKDRGGFLQRGRLADLHLTSSPETNAITWEFRDVDHAPEDEPFRPTTLMERASAYLQKQDEPVSFATVMGDVKGTDAHIKTALERLIHEGYATEEQGPRNARLVRHSTLFTGQEPPLRTSASPLRADVQSTSATSASLQGDAAEVEAAEQTSPLRPEQVDLYDEAVQHLLDDKEIPW